MSTPVNPDDPQQLQYTVGIIYDTNIDIGSSQNYGTADINTGSIMTATSTKVAPDTQVTFRAYPDTATGFKFKGWYDPDTGLLMRIPNPYRVTISGGDLFLVPAFEPDGITHNRPIDVEVEGYTGTNLVRVSSMNGYYSYSIGTGTTNFNYGSEDPIKILPDGKSFQVRALEIEGYAIQFLVNGIDQSSAAVHQTTEGQGDRTNSSSSSGTYTADPHSEDPGEPGTLTSLSTPTYQYLTVNNTTMTRMVVRVNYIPETPDYTLKVVPVPRFGGTVSANVVGSERTGTELTVPAGTEVKISAVPSAGYSFTYWKSTSGQTIGIPVATVTVDEDVTWTAQFNQPNNSITVKAEPANGGTVSILDAGVVFARTTIYSNEASGSTVTLRAVPNPNYNFLYWYLEGDDSADHRNTDSEIIVEFGEVDLTYVAKFAYVPSGSILFKAYTSTVENGVVALGSGDPQVFFKATYNRSSGGTQTVSIGASEQDLDVLVQNDSEGYYTIIRLVEDGPYTVEENGHLYRYTLTKFKYADRYISPTGISHSSWNNIDDLTPYGDWRMDLDYPGYNETERIGTHTLSAFFSKEELFSVRLSNSIPSSPSGTSEIALEGGGTYTGGSEVTVSTHSTLGEDYSGRYEFVGWYDSTDMETVLSTDPEYTFEVTGDIHLVAVYNEFCFLTYSASPSGLGTVSCSIPSGTWVEYDSEISLTATPVEGAGVLRWTKGGSQFAGAVEEVTISARTPVITIVVYLIETSKKLTLRVGTGGTVDIELETNGAYSWTAPDAGTDHIYTIPSGSGFRATATPEARFIFDRYKFLDSSGAELDTTTATVFERSSLTTDCTLDATFKYIPWVTTLGTIIKVY